MHDALLLLPLLTGFAIAAMVVIFSAFALGLAADRRVLARRWRAPSAPDGCSGDPAAIQPPAQASSADPAAVGRPPTSSCQRR